MRFPPCILLIPFARFFFGGGWLTMIDGKITQKSSRVPHTCDEFAHVRQVHQDQFALTHVGQKARRCRLQHVEETN